MSGSNTSSRAPTSPTNRRAATSPSSSLSAASRLTCSCLLSGAIGQQPIRPCFAALPRAPPQVSSAHVQSCSRTLMSTCASGSASAGLNGFTSLTLYPGQTRPLASVGCQFTLGLLILDLPFGYKGGSFGHDLSGPEALSHHCKAYRPYDSSLGLRCTVNMNIVQYTSLYHYMYCRLLYY